MAVLRVAMEQDDGVALTGNEVVELHAIDGSVAVGDRGSRIRFGIASRAKRGHEQHHPRISEKAVFHQHGVPFVNFNRRNHRGSAPHERLKEQRHGLRRDLHRRVARRCSVARQSSGDTSKTEGMSRLSKLPAIIAQFALREMSSMA
jgi:hypothetical protein